MPYPISARLLDFYLGMERSVLMPAQIKDSLHFSANQKTSRIFVATLCNWASNPARFGHGNADTGSAPPMTNILLKEQNTGSQLTAQLLHHSWHISARP